MASTALNFFQFRENKTFRWGDVFIAESRIGLRKQQIEQSKHLLLAYQFSAGLMANYLVNPELEIGIMLVPLKFSSDKVAPNVSGSYWAIRYASKNIAATFQYESRSLSFMGWLVASTLNPHQYTLELLFKKKYGMRAVWASNSIMIKSMAVNIKTPSPASVFFMPKLYENERNERLLDL